MVGGPENGVVMGLGAVLKWMKRFMPVLLIAAPTFSWAGSLAGEPTLTGEPMTPEEFRDYAEGYTLYFERDGEFWGSESFTPGGAVTWRYPSGDCMNGVWRAYEGRACFYYGIGREVLCWDLSQERQAIRGVLLDGPDAGLELKITRRDRRPLLCSDGGEAL
ncbi:MAG: hypothetical protein AAF371_19525 [Pseudomonadota bacterium]